MRTQVGAEEIAEVVARATGIPVSKLMQGERDPFGTKEEVELYPLSRKIRLAWMADGDHDFKPRVASGHTWKENLAQAADDAANFIYV